MRIMYCLLFVAIIGCLNAVADDPDSQNVEGDEGLAPIPTSVHTQSPASGETAARGGSGPVLASDVFRSVSVDFPKPVAVHPIKSVPLWSDQQLPKWFDAFKSEFSSCPGVASPELADLLLLTTISYLNGIEEAALKQLRLAARYQEKLIPVIRKRLVNVEVANKVKPDVEAKWLDDRFLDTLAQRRKARSQEQLALARDLTAIWDEVLSELQSGKSASERDGTAAAILSEVKDIDVPDGTEKPTVVDSRPDVELLRLSLPDLGDRVYALVARKWLESEPRYSANFFRSATYKDLQNTAGRLRLPARNSGDSDLGYLRRSVDGDADNLRALSWCFLRVATGQDLVSEKSALLTAVREIDAISELIAARIEHAAALRDALRQASRARLRQYNDGGVSLGRAEQAIECLETISHSLKKTQTMLDDFAVGRELQEWSTVAGRVPGADLQFISLEQRLKDKLQEIRTRGISKKRQLSIREQLGY